MHNIHIHFKISKKTIRNRTHLLLSSTIRFCKIKMREKLDKKHTYVDTHLKLAFKFNSNMNKVRLVVCFSSEIYQVRVSQSNMKTFPFWYINIVVWHFDFVHRSPNCNWATHHIHTKHESIKHHQFKQQQPKHYLIIIPF